MLEVNIHKYLEKTDTLKEKRQRLVLMGKKSNSTGSPRLRETLEWNTCFDLGIQRLSTKILGCPPSAYST